MTLDQVLTHFGSRKALCEALKITNGAVSLWKGRVPINRQYQLQLITGGKLRAEEPQKAA